MNWYVLYTKRNQEIKTAQIINNLSLNVEAFCPTITKIKTWSDRKKKVSAPLLNSIIFIKTNERNRNKVFVIPSVVRYLFWLGKPAIVKEKEIDQLHFITQNKSVVSHKVETIKQGEKLNLEPFGFDNMTGTVDKISKNNYWVVLETLGFTVKVTLK